MRHLAGSAALVTLSLTGIVWLTQALRFIDFIISRGISFGSFLELTLLLIPSLLLFILPFALLCAALYVYYRLTMDSEMLVLASAGLSRWQLAVPALCIGALATLIAYAISFSLLPASYARFKDMQTDLRDNYASLLLQEDVFNTPIDGLTVYIREREGDGTLHGIIVHDGRDEKKPPVTMMAEEGQLVQTAQGPRFILSRGSRQTLEHGKLSLLNFDQYTLDISFYAEGQQRRLPQPEEMTVPELFANDHPGDEGWHLRVEGHNRVLWPLFSLILSLFSVAMLLSHAFNRRGAWRRVALIVALAAAALCASIGFFNLAMSHPWMVALMYGNPLGLLLFSLWLLTDRRPAPPPTALGEAAR